MQTLTSAGSSVYCSKLVTPINQSSLINLNEHPRELKLWAGWSSLIRWKRDLCFWLYSNLIQRLKWSFRVNNLCKHVSSNIPENHQQIGKWCLWFTPYRVHFKWHCVLYLFVNSDSALNEQTDAVQQETLWITFWIYASVWMTSVTLWKLTPASSVWYFESGRTADCVGMLFDLK